MLFEVGQTVITRGLHNTIENNEQAQKEVSKIFNRYINGDWGNLDDYDKKLNDNAVKYNNDRILGKYHINSINRDIYIITEFDRSYTTFLFCNEY